MQIICPLVAIAIAGLIVAILHGYGHRQAHVHYVAVMSERIGADLITQTNSDLLLQVDPGLRAELSELLRSQTSVAAMRFGDEPPPVGDGKAHTRIILTNISGQELLIRLRADGSSNRFRILSHRMQKTAPPSD